MAKHMNENIEVLRDNLEKLIIERKSLVDCEVVSLSQELDRLIVECQVCKALNINY